jgi:hypothetical protein
MVITALAFSRLVFAVFHDPEGPNLLVVTALAAVIYLVSIAVYLPNIYPSVRGGTRTATAIFVQILVAAGVYLVMR